MITAVYDEMRENCSTGRAWISNIAFPTSTEELLNVLGTDVGRFDTELIVNSCSDIQWTVPAWAHRGDIVFFMHSVSAINKIRAVRKKVTESVDRYSEDEIALMRSGIDRAMGFYQKYGGKIIGVARLKTEPVRGFTETFRHWKCTTYAVIADTCAFVEPLDYTAFRDRITISRTGAVTPLYDETYRYLITLLSRSNVLPEFLQNAAVCDATGQSKSFLHDVYDTEDQFRSMVADRLLKTLSHRVYRECRCIKTGIPDSFADNVIMIGGKYLTVEVKRSWKPESIREQLWKYCYNDQIELDRSVGISAEPQMLWQRFALLVDPNSVSVYDAKTDRLTAIAETDALDQDTILDLRDELEEIFRPEECETPDLGST